MNPVSLFELSVQDRLIWLEDAATALRLVGDAGYNKDFITAQGISDAFRDAALCATALDESFSGARSFDVAMGAYQSTRDAHVFRELLEQGYSIISADYRGSTGYGRGLYEQIDYGGLEIDDVKAARDWAVENLGSVDPRRVGIIGWSHGGYQTLMNIFRWPDAYQAAYAGVPVSDLVQRMGYKSQGYRNTFKEFMGKEAVDDPMEYRRRSPYFYADKLATPLLIDAT